jgi:serine-type D-Ala-D-Ala carboxypeptidase (penicillin-binding protein 5/6)
MRPARPAAAFVAALGMTAPVLSSAAQAAPSLSVRSAILSDEATGKELYGVASQSEVPIASTTKLMTALITLEHAHLGRVFTEPNFYFPPIDSQIGLAPGERMSVHDLLIALLLPSADDAAQDLAYNVGRRSVARFVGMMNARARQLGLRHTHYSTPTGLSSADHSSAGDLVKLAAYVLRTQPFFARVVATPHAVLRTGNHPRSVNNRNDLVGRYSWVKGVKTGHTSQAGYVLVGLGERHGMRLLSAVLGTSSESSRDANTLALLDYGFSNFRLFKPVVQGEVLARPTVKDSPGKHAVVVAGQSFKQVLARGSRVKLVVKVPHQLAGPLAARTVVGTVTLFAAGRPLARIPLLLARRLPAVSPLTIAAHFVTRTSTLVLLALVCILAISVTARRRLRMRHTGEEGAEPA